MRAKKVINNIAGHISFGELLYSFRDAKYMTQIEFSELLNISKQDLCNIETGRKLVSVEQAMKLADHLGHSQKVFVKYVLQDQLLSAGVDWEV